jgi:uncharacterized phage protein (TIGR02220 family)
MIHGLYYRETINRLIPIKKEPSEKKDYLEVQKKVLNYFNECRLKMGISKQAVKLTPERKNLINARLKGGYTQSDMIKVIHDRFKAWGNNPEMKRHLTLETLFRDSCSEIKQTNWTDQENNELGQNESPWG